MLTWLRRHILKDIDPYICLFEGCDKPDDCFKTVDDWLNHVQWQHTLVLSCQSVGHESEFFGSRTELEQHMKLEHSGEFSETQLSFLIHNSAKPSPDTFAAFARARQSIGASEDTTSLCPLCPFYDDKVEIPPQSTTLDSHDRNLKDREFKNILDHITSHMESIALLSLPADNCLDSGVSDELLSQSRGDIEVDQSLPPADFVDELGEEMTLAEGLSGEAPPIDDYLVKDGWSYVLEAPDVQKLIYSEPEHDKILQPFVARYISEKSDKKLQPFVARDISERIQIPLSPHFTVPFRRDPNFVDRGNILAQIDEKCSKSAARAALVGLGGVGYEINPSL